MKQSSLHAAATAFAVVFVAFASAAWAQPATFSVDGVIAAESGGFRFPDGTVQRTTCKKCPRLFAVDVQSSELLSIDVTTAQVTVIGPLGLPGARAGLEFHPDGTLYGVFYNGSQDILATVDTETGIATPLATLGQVFDGRGIAFAPDCRQIYLIDLSGNLYRIDLLGGVQLVGASSVESSSLERSPFGYFAVNTTNGFLSRIGVLSGQGVDLFDLGAALGTNHFVNALAFSQTTGLLFAADDELENLVVIDPVAEEAAIVGSYGSRRIGGLAFEP